MVQQLISPLIFPRFDNKESQLYNSISGCCKNKMLDNDNKTKNHGDGIQQ